MQVHPLRAGTAVLLAVLALVGLVVLARGSSLPPRPIPDAEAPAVVPAPPVRATGQAGASAGPRLDPAWVEATARSTGISPVAVSAYARAQLVAPAGCGLGWTTLAGVGWVESQHGTFGGRTLRADGTSSTPIVGPALDGEDGVKAIRATAVSTRWHDDPRWDHAVGPMQFLPTTWEEWGADGDGDGVADPHDLDDAALGAARYLCADGRDLTSDAGWSDAVLSYNYAGFYLDEVHAAAVRYAAGA